MDNVALVDIVDHVLNRGAVVLGECTISLGDVDLIYLEIQLVLSSIETLRQARTGVKPEPARIAVGVPSRNRQGNLEREAWEPLPYREEESGSASLPGASLTGGQVPLAQAREPETEGDKPGQGPERSLAQLVLTLIELLRQIVERQAIRRTEGGSLSEEQVERLGLSLMELEAKMVELRDMFGLEEDDIQLDLGPLGRLL